MMEKLEIPMPESGMAVNVDEALAIAETHRLSGHGTSLLCAWAAAAWRWSTTDEALTSTICTQAVGVTPDRPILIDRFLHHATECEADAISDGEHVFVPAVMEHIELAGVHSGDSACMLPSRRPYQEACGDHQGLHPAALPARCRSSG